MPERVLLTVSGTMPRDSSIEPSAGHAKPRPQADYLAMAARFPADLIDYPIARQQTGWFGALLARLGGPALMLAWACFMARRRYQVIFTDGEQVGIPLAFLLKFLGGHPRPSHFMIAHVLSVGKKQILLDLMGLHTHIDTFFVYSDWQRRFIEKRWNVPSSRVVLTPFMVDDSFFAPSHGNPANLPFSKRDERPIICSAGLELRDYPTLMEAVDGLDVQVVIAAASPWSKRGDTTRNRHVPDNVVVCRLSQFDLRDLYAASRFVVMPLLPANFQVGVTAILEALAMGKPVICSRVAGQTDVIQQGVNGYYVPPGDPAALRQAIRNLLEDPEQAERMGRQGRRLVEEKMSLRHYVDRLAGYVREAQTMTPKSSRIAEQGD
jgi:glycosyltransferase involved in cell wall biosynthesis